METLGCPCVHLVSKQEPTIVKTGTTLGFYGANVNHFTGSLLSASLEASPTVLTAFSSLLICFLEIVRVNKFLRLV